MKNDMTKMINGFVPRWLRSAGYDLVISEVHHGHERADFVGFGLHGGTRLVEVKTDLSDAAGNILEAHHHDTPDAMGDDRWLATTRELFSKMRSVGATDLWTREGWGIVTFSRSGWLSYEIEEQAKPRSRTCRRSDMAALVRLVRRGDFRRTARFGAGVNSCDAEAP